MKCGTSGCSAKYQGGYNIQWLFQEENYQALEGRTFSSFPQALLVRFTLTPQLQRHISKVFVVFNGNTTTETINLYLAEDNVGALDTIDAATKPQQFVDKS